jgi:glucan endo-1,3-beta-D-glucosidase
MIQAGTTNTPIEAIPAAISTSTTLLLGLWASAGQDIMTNEIAALQAAVSQYGAAFTDLVVGISVGSEDMYRISPTGINNLSGPGTGPDVIANYISQVRAAIASSGLSSKPVGHVDTWTAWANSSNSAAAAASDFLGMDAYPYYETTNGNDISNALSLFNSALSQTQAASQGKPVWVTETGWPTTGATEAQAVPNAANAKTFWDEVGCGILFGKINTWWFTLEDPNFGVVGNSLSTTPLYDLTCPASSSVLSFSTHSATTFSSVSRSTISGASSAPSARPSLSTFQSLRPSSLTSQASGSLTSGIVSGEASVSTHRWSFRPPVQPNTVPTSRLRNSTRPTSSLAALPWLTSLPAVPLTRSSTTPLAALPWFTGLSGVPPRTTTFATVPFPSTSPHNTPAVPSTQGCPLDLSGPYLAPSLIIPLSKMIMNKTAGTSYYGYLSTTTSTVFTFDVPSSATGKTCQLIFMLTGGRYSITGRGQLVAYSLDTPVGGATSYEALPQKDLLGQSQSDVDMGVNVIFGRERCGGAGQRSFLIESTGNLNLTYFQTRGEPAVGAWIRIC